MRYDLCEQRPWEYAIYAFQQDHRPDLRLFRAYGPVLIIPFSPSCPIRKKQISDRQRCDHKQDHPDCCKHLFRFPHAAAIDVTVIGAGAFFIQERPGKHLCIDIFIPLVQLIEMRGVVSASHCFQRPLRHDAVRKGIPFVMRPVGCKAFDRSRQHKILRDSLPLQFRVFRRDVFCRSFFCRGVSCRNRFCQGLFFPAVACRPAPGCLRGFRIRIDHCGHGHRLPHFIAVSQCGKGGKIHGDLTVFFRHTAFVHGNISYIHQRFIQYPYAQIAVFPVRIQYSRSGPADPCF